MSPSNAADQGGKVRIRITNARAKEPYENGQVLEVDSRVTHGWHIRMGALGFFVATDEAEEIPADEPRLGPEPIGNRRELATVLAALRYWQREGIRSGGAEHDIASDGETLQPLTVEEIDELCERINGADST